MDDEHSMSKEIVSQLTGKKHPLDLHLPKSLHITYHSIIYYAATIPCHFASINYYYTYRK